MAVWGLDVEQVQGLSSQLNQEASEIQRILSTLTNALNNVQWSGPDSTKFRNDWSGTHTAELNKVITALQEASQAAARNAMEQQNASQG
jgi:uncharacterized protein YukE